MTEPINGIHHVTAIAADAQQTHDFYTKALGLRFVKKTVNFDDQTAYHLYFGDSTGKPGTILTFFNWALPAGKKGTGSIQSIAFQIPQDSVSYWEKRLKNQKIKFEKTIRFGETVLGFKDNSEMPVELVEQAKELKTMPWNQSVVPVEHAIRGIAGVSLLQAGFSSTAQFLEKTLEFRAKQENELHRFESGNSFVDLEIKPDEPFARQGNGSIHHTAFRVKNEPQQKEWQKYLASKNTDVTPIVERFYFKSIYFHEPQGALFEIATDPPGFLVDQTIKELGKTLTLPPWFESLRPQIEKNLPKLKTEQ